MMRLVASVRYAIQALVHMARDRDGAVFTSHAIARAEGIPETYLFKALKSLVDAGVLVSNRGSYGGYQLDRPAKSITVLDVVEAVHEPVRGYIAAVPDGADSPTNRRLQSIMDDIAAATRRTLAKVTVADLAR